MRHAIRLLFFLIILAVPIQVRAEEPTPMIEVNIGEAGQKRASYPIGASHRWLLRCTFPETEDLREHTILQTLPPSLSLDPDSVIVQFFPDLGEGDLLQMETDYTLTCGSVFVEGGTSDRLSLSMTEAGNARIRRGGELRILYEAALKETAPIGTQILVSAQLNCVSGSGRREVYLSERAAVYTGGLNLLLTDPENQPVPGGRFMLAREASQEEIADPDVRKEHLDIDGIPTAVVYERFFSGGALESVARTDSRGEASLMGLAFGTYYLVRIDLPGMPVAVTVDESSHLTRSDGWRDGEGRAIDNTVRIENTLILLPRTGGRGTLGVTICGIFVMLCAGILLWNNRKRPVYIR